MQAISNMKLMMYKMLSFAVGIVVVELLLTFAGVGYNLLQRTQNPQSLDRSKFTKVVLCLGESTTAWGLSDSYPAQLQKILNKHYGLGKYLVINEGESGSDTDEIVANLDQKIARYQPDIIITMMGINDYWRLAQNKSWFSDFKLYQLFRLIQINYPRLIHKFTTKTLHSSESTVSPDEPLIFENVSHEPEFLEAQALYHQKQFALAFEKLSALNSNNLNSSQLSLYLALVSLELGHKEQGLRFFEKFAALQKTAAAYSFAGEHYYNRFGVFDPVNQRHARHFFKKALEINPKNFSALKHLGCSYVNNLSKEPELRKDALNHLNTAVSLSLHDANAIICLADLYILENKLQEALTVLRQGLHLSVGSGFFIRTRLIETYLKLRDYENAKEILQLTKEQFETNPQLHFLETEIISQSKGELNSTKKITAYNFYEHPETLKNYRKLAGRISQNKILHVVLQYPLRSIMPIKNELSEFSNVIYIENIKNFEIALKAKTYDEIFIDKFAGDFGHFTAYGSQLISENIFNHLKAEKVIP